MNVVKVKLSELRPDPDNTRVHDLHNIDVIKGSLKKFGQYRPFVVQKDGMIIRIGNGMYQAMKDLGWEEADCEIKDLTDEEATTLSILDNKASDLSYFDDNVLFSQLKKISPDSVQLTGFVDVELNKLSAAFEESGDLSSVKDIIENADEKPEKPEKAPVLQYMIVFQEEEQFRRWNKFVSWLRDNSNGSIAESILQIAEEKMQGADAE